MEIRQIIEKKQNRQELSFEELFFVVNNYVSGKIDDKDMSDFLFSTISGGLNENETFNLTEIMCESGQKYDLSEFDKTIDKHSTGGVSDSTTLLVVPLFALFGYTCLKMSGAGLSHTGGTADKVLVFKGFQNQLPFEKAKQIAHKTGGCFITSSSLIAPADKKIYALRDKIGAMSIPLIASSIMSKKLACGAKYLILDVKYGNGAFMGNKAQANRLGKTMKKIGKMHGVETEYILGDMNQPLGTCVGDKLEVWEVLDLLASPKPTRLFVHSLNLVATMVAKIDNCSFEQAYKRACEFVVSGKALEKLKQIVCLQGGKIEPNQNFVPNHLVTAQNGGIITSIQTKKLGFLDKQCKNCKNYVGFRIMVEIGQKIKQNDVLFELYFDDQNITDIKKQFENTIRIKHEN